MVKVQILNKVLTIYIGNNCYNPTSGICFIKCNIYFTKKDYTKEFLTFIQTEQRKCNV